ncbi:glycogen debranching protein GlgX [Lysobacter sp. D1-1-M9]|uniref:glycogen debranching protein GlgX n=1 Tax=Novilysobacter longmucuonensis TaxID=3098603 RepID=UPI002FC7F0C1
MPTLPDRIERGRPYPLGACSDGTGTNFAVFSENASALELCLFEATGRRQIGRYMLPEFTDGIWHGYLPSVRGGQLYGYRAHGPYQPEQGHRFNPHKLLVDPYARMLHGQVRWTDALHGYRLNSPRADLSFDRRDSAAAVPKSMVVDDHFHWRGDRHPAVPWERTVIYEAHLRGLTQRLEHVRPHERGTFAALADPRLIDHLLRLGITSIELLPIHAFVQDRRLAELKLRNYWGYNTLAFFAPEPGYVLERNLHEIRHAVQSLHQAGIEIVLDVVYNHTCEGNELGPTLSFRGLDNASYYRLLPDNPRHCINDTGCGNTLNTSHPRVIQLIMDSLRYWVEEFHIDGFRFDLGVALGREAHGFDPNAGLFDAIRQDPVLAHVKLISEPWDLGPGGYQLGNHPPGFAEWNGQFRDDVRRFWKGDEGLRGALAERLQASAELFDYGGRRPWASVNFLTAHDGFTLHDLVSYNHKHNQDNAEQNRDGHDDNASYNWGAEGETDDPAILAQREKIKRALLATLLLSHGTPMLLAGDEFGRTQGGNNNAYCQDNEISWLDWSLLDTEPSRELLAFTSRLVALRQAHFTLRLARFVHGENEPWPGVHDLAWFDERGHLMTQGAWDNPQGRLLTVRRAATHHDGRIEVSLLLINGSQKDREFRLPGPPLPWLALLDSAQPQAVEQRVDGADGALTVGAQSVRLLVARPSAPAARE